MAAHVLCSATCFWRRAGYDNALTLPLFMSDGPRFIEVRRGPWTSFRLFGSNPGGGCSLFLRCQWSTGQNTIAFTCEPALNFCWRSCKRRPRSCMKYIPVKPQQYPTYYYYCCYCCYNYYYSYYYYYYYYYIPTTAIATATATILLLFTRERRHWAPVVFVNVCAPEPMEYPPNVSAAVFSTSKTSSISVCVCEGLPRCFFASPNPLKHCRL